MHYWFCENGTCLFGHPDPTNLPSCLMGGKYLRNFCLMKDLSSCQVLDHSKVITLEGRSRGWQFPKWERRWTAGTRPLSPLLMCVPRAAMLNNTAWMMQVLRASQYLGTYLQAPLQRQKQNNESCLPKAPLDTWNEILVESF